MVLLEIAAQGVRGLALAGGRIALRPGYNVVNVDGTLFRRLLEALLYPESSAEPLTRAAPGQGGSSARAGLTVVGNDGVTLRVVRDLNGGTQLQRFDPERRAFQLVSQDAAQIAQVLGGPTGIPSCGRLGALLTLSAADLPSRQSLALAARPAPPRKALAPDEARTRLASLQSELAKAQVAEKLQYQLDGLQARFFKVEELLKAGEQLRARLRGAEEALAGLQPVADAAKALGDPEGRIAAFERSALRKDEALTRIGAERQALVDAEAHGRPVPFWRLPGFALGLGGAAAVIAFAPMVGVRALALLAIPASGYSAFLALHWATEAQEVERSARRAQLLEVRERKAVDNHNRENADVVSTMKALGVESLSDLREALTQFQRAQGTASEERERLAEWEQRPETKGAESEKASLMAQIAEVEAKLTEEAGGYVRETRAVEAEIERIQGELQAPSESLPEIVPAAPAGDSLKAAMERIAAERSETLGAALRTVQPRLLQLLPAISAQRFSALRVDERGNLFAQAGDRPVLLSALSPADRDLCFVALKLAFLEQTLAAGRSVSLIDDALAGFGEPTRRSLARLLKQLGRVGQILHATADVVFREAADHCA